jgi:hypothetical protein
MPTGYFALPLSPRHIVTILEGRQPPELTGNALLAFFTICLCDDLGDFLTVLPFMTAGDGLVEFLHEKVAEIGEVFAPAAGIPGLAPWVGSA